MFHCTKTSAIARAASRFSLGRAATAVPARLLSSVPAKSGWARSGVRFTGLSVAPKQKSWAVAGVRHYSVLTQSAAKEYKYTDIKALAQGAGADANTLLIDVREPAEFVEGHIPGALNVPFKSSPGAFDLPEDEFEESFGFPKPAKDQELVFYCLGGVRSTAAEELANSFGYTKRGNYVGSWEDWVTQENAASQKA
ncbi:hypothetical protein JCM33374_g1473 [Metschnikowia sp. JCM 33374]|nr:hypothetical protein JCM33374_g1473 [Metschnikowia sp. JCM 33374]